jgi:hypothetical protein
LAPQKYLGLWLVFSFGVLAGVYGVVLVLLERDVEPAVALAAGGLGLVAWVIFHPARGVAARG